MSIRGARVLVAGASAPGGERLVEAFLALGAHVVAADGLRTRLEELRGRLRQHERLWVAECDLDSSAAAAALFRDVARDEAIDAALIALPGGASLDSWVARCERFLLAALAAMARGGRVITVVEGGRDEPRPAPVAAVAELVAAADARGRELGIDVCGLAADLAQPAMLEHLVALSDPARPALVGWTAPP